MTSEHSISNGRAAIDPAGRRTITSSSLMREKVRMHRPTKGDPDHLKKVGKVRSVVFHPKKARVLGYMVQRPDLAWMFKRGDVFVTVNGLSEEEGELVLSGSAGTHGKEAERMLRKEHGIALDDCLIWLGMPVMTTDGRLLGIIKDIGFDADSGIVRFLDVGEGATADAILGNKRIPAGMIRGFKRGAGTLLSDATMGALAEGGVEGDSLGAIMVSPESADVKKEGGVAEKAGAATAVAADKAKRVRDEVAKRTEGMRAKAGDKMEQASEAVGDAMEKGAFVTGRQISRAGGMFSGFKDEFLKAMEDDDGEDG